MQYRPLISLCIPTNGVVEWVFPVLESIYKQDVDERHFEVVITDNGNNREFYSLMSDYCVNHQNIIYEKTHAGVFQNEIEAYKRASGRFIKFINHRTLLKEGTLKEWLIFIDNNWAKKPIVYFSNGVLKMKKVVHTYSSFDEYVLNLSYFSSWSTGMAFWKEDFDKMPNSIEYNDLFPHTAILFHEKNRNNYIIDNRELLEELPTGNIPKGNYDLFYAFAVEYPSILYDLYRDHAISLLTFIKVKEDNLKFIATLYFDFIIRNRYCSYDLSSYDTSIRVFYSHQGVKKEAVYFFVEKIKNKLVSIAKAWSQLVHKNRCR